ncbi:unnamed protein product [Scytosiphon promiscuus]
MGWLPLWSTPAAWRRPQPRAAPSASARRKHNQRKRGISDCSTESSSSETQLHQQQQKQQRRRQREEDGGGPTCGLGGAESPPPPPPPPSPPPPPPPPPLSHPSPRRRRIAAALLLLSGFLAVVALLRPVPTGQKRAGASSTGSAVVTKLPFLEGEDGQAGARADAAHWTRVRSSAAMHPAMYVPADGVVYCPIAKVACAEWRKTLRWMLGIPDWDTGPIHDQGKNGIPLLARRKARDVELVMNDSSWLKFVVVRDPADRLLSGFLNKCVGGEWQNCPYVEFMPERFEGVKARTPDTDAKFRGAMNDEPRKVFRDFLQGVRKDVRVHGCKVNSHWRPQFCFCSIARFIDSYHVIPFANMSTEAVNLVDEMRRPSPARADLLREFMVSRFSSNQDAKAQGATTKRQKYFSREALDIIKMVYAKDYSLFGEHFENHTATRLG